MKIKLTIFFVFQLFLSSFGQKNNMAKIPPGIPTNTELATERRNHNCIHRYSKSFSTRLKNYPFNKAAQIRLVSYFAQPISKDKPDVFVHSGLPMENDTICYSKLHEIKNLTLRQVDSLTDILFNVGFRGPTFLISEIKCYEPRNGILFVDALGKTFENVEICFGCDKANPSNERIKLGEFCEQKYELLKKFFIQAGIKYGTIETETPE